MGTNDKNLGGFDTLGDVIGNLNFDKFKGRVEEEYKKMHPMSIINIGKTGVGKSTIINAVFNRNLAKTGIGKPCTQHCDSYTLHGSPITIYDSKGLETGGETNTAIFEELNTLIKKQNSTGNTKEYIHICWYCVLDGGNKLDDNEIDIINKIRQTIPVIIILTQAVGGSRTNEFVSEIIGMFNDSTLNVIPIMAIPKKENSDYGEINVKSHGLDKLVEISYELLPESVKGTFSTYQMKNMQLKRGKAFTACTLYSGAVAAAAFQPFPVADAPIMVGIQVLMMVNITACFGIQASNFNFKSILSGLGGPFAAAFVGRTLVSLLKLIPGVGTLAGGMINATTGAVITFSIGSIYIGVLSSLLEKNAEITEDEIVEELKKAAKNINLDEMKKEWEKNKNNYSESEAKQIVTEVENDLGKKL